MNAPTQHLNREVEAAVAEKAGVKPALSQVPRGYWRNRWHSTIGWGHSHPDNIIIDQHTQLSGRKYPSRELAEAYAHRKMRDEFPQHVGIVTHSQVFFPANPESPSP